MNLLFLFFILFLAARSGSSQIVISQVSFGSEKSAIDEYVEIFNPSSNEIINVSLWRLQYRSSRTTPWRTLAVIPEDTFIRPKSFYLIASKNYTTVNVRPDLVGNFGFGISSDSSLRIIDFEEIVIDLVGYGPDAPESETRPIEKILGEVIIRKDPLRDTNDNSRDFRAQTLRAPRNMGGLAEVARPVRAETKQESIEAARKEEAKDIAIENRSVRAELLLAEAKHDYGSGRWLSAYEKTEKALFIIPDNMAVRSFQNRMVTEVKRKLERATLVGVDEFYGKAFLFYVRGDLRSAVNELRKILALQPRRIEAREFYAKFTKTLAPKGERQQEVTIEIIDDRIITPKEPKRPRRARPDRKATPSIAPKEQVDKPARSLEKAEELYEKGLHEFAEGRLTEAIKLWEQALRYNPEHTRAQRALHRARRRIER